MSVPESLANFVCSIGHRLSSWQRFAIARYLPSKANQMTQKHINLSLMTLSAVASIGMLAALPSGSGITIAQAQTFVALPTPNLTETIATIQNNPNVHQDSLWVHNGETLYSLFARLNIKDTRALAWLRKAPLARPFVNPQAGQFLSAGVYADGRLSYLRLYMDGPHTNDSRTIEISRYGDEFQIRRLPFTFDKEEVTVDVTIQESLTKTALKNKIPEEVLEQVKAVWEGQVDPIKNIRPNDQLRLVYEKKFADGFFVRNGQLLAIQVIKNDKTIPEVYEAFWFDKNQAGSFYTLDGQSSRQTFMRIPLESQSVSSEFAPLRRHPVTGVIRPHNGTDFRAPSGSRIFAASNGTISFVGYEKRGYGHYIKIDHGDGRTTLYAHMSRLQKGIRKGMKVKKGDIIGYVGMTGLATGPHLHYELMIDGIQVNPKTADLPDTENLSDFQLAQLTAQSEGYIQLFDHLAQEKQLAIPSMLKHEEKQRAMTAQKDTEKTQTNDTKVS